MENKKTIRHIQVPNDLLEVSKLDFKATLVYMAIRSLKYPNATDDGRTIKL